MCIGLAALCVYTLTLSPGVVGGDSGEFILAAYDLGAARTEPLASIGNESGTPGVVPIAPRAEWELASCIEIDSINPKYLWTRIARG